MQQPGVPAEPTDVFIGIQLQQLTGVDQRLKNFGVVAALKGQWNDPAFAFDPATCDCTFKTYRMEAGLNRLLQESGVSRFPAVTIYNQQSRRFAISLLITVESDGTVTYFERFVATLQAPDFDFRNFPFDRQRFFIRIDALLPEEYYVFKELPEFSEMGPELGAEEWVIPGFETSIENRDGYSSFEFSFDAERQLTYYVTRVFLPIFIIIAVSWFAFFLRDYDKRLDVTRGTLLAFIAFNFTIANDLPSLGYLTLMDKIIMSTFVITGLAILVSVYMKRLEADEKGDKARAMDKYVICGYPLAYVVLGIVTYLFL